MQAGWKPRCQRPRVSQQLGVSTKLQTILVATSFSHGEFDVHRTWWLLASRRPSGITLPSVAHLSAGPRDE